MTATNDSRKIRSIELINFMNHVNTKIDLVDGINLITGSSDNGKSAIMRALYSVLLDKHDSGWIRHGEKEYTIRITFFNGDVIERTKGKNNIISMTPYNQKTVTAQSYGKDMPIEFKNFIGHIPETSEGSLPFSVQKKDVFLIDKKELTLGQEISVLLQVDDLEKGASNIKKELTRYNTQIKDNEAEKEKLEAELEKYSDLDRKLQTMNELDQTLLDHKELFDQMQDKQQFIIDGIELYNQAKKINKILARNKSIHNLLNEELVEIEKKQSILDDKNYFITTAQSLKDRFEEIKKNEKIALEFVEGDLGQLVKKIETLEETFNDKNQILDDCSDAAEELKKINKSIETLNIDIENYNKQIEELLEQQRTTKVICSSCEGEGYVTIYKAEVNVQ